MAIEGPWKVEAGDTIWDIAASLYGQRNPGQQITLQQNVQFMEDIIAANLHQLKQPKKGRVGSLINPGMELVIPPSLGGAPSPGEAAIAGQETPGGGTSRLGGTGGGGQRGNYGRNNPATSPTGMNSRGGVGQTPYGPTARESNAAEARARIKAAADKNRAAAGQNRP